MLKDISIRELFVLAVIAQTFVQAGTLELETHHIAINQAGLAVMI
jgi:hypothetical protein